MKEHGENFRGGVLKTEEFLNHERIWRKIWESDFDINDEIELREKTSERINEMEE